MVLFSFISSLSSGDTKILTDQRQYTPLDKFLMTIEQGRRSIFNQPMATRASPAETLEMGALTASEQRHSAGLMRINHTGEVCAQALYQSQALTARTSLTKESMRQAAFEENDHLAWCCQRLIELNSHTSYLAAFWYVMSFGIGACAGLAGDQWSLGFVAETERQVVAHLDDHLGKLPAADLRSAKILEQMREDEAHHATLAIEAGAAELPTPIKILMRGMAKVMTLTTYWI